MDFVNVENFWKALKTNVFGENERRTPLLDDKCKSTQMLRQQEQLVSSQALNHFGVNLVVFFPALPTSVIIGFECLISQRLFVLQAFVIAPGIDDNIALVLKMQSHIFFFQSMRAWDLTCLESFSNECPSYAQ